jgi:hypothetical protein
MTEAAKAIFLSHASQNAAVAARIGDPLVDSLRNEPRFKAVLAGLRFPD